MKTKALKLEGVKQFKIIANRDSKLDIIAEVHTKMDSTMSMVFVNQRNVGYALQKKLKAKDISA